MSQKVKIIVIPGFASAEPYEIDEPWRVVAALPEYYPSGSLGGKVSAVKLVLVRDG